LMSSVLLIGCSVHRHGYRAPKVPELMFLWPEASLRPEQQQSPRRIWGCTDGFTYKRQGVGSSGLGEECVKARKEVAA